MQSKEKYNESSEKSRLRRGKYDSFFRLENFTTDEVLYYTISQVLYIIISQTILLFIKRITFSFVKIFSYSLIVTYFESYRMFKIRPFKI